jgi:CBS domain containing-hemolysin-like protein
VLALHVISVALAKALRTYSRSRLEDLCERRGHARRADEIARFDERTERAVESLATLTGLALAAMLGVTAGRVAPHLEAESVAAIALIIGALGHLFAGVLGRVHAERVLVALWPVAVWIRRLMTPFTLVSRTAEALSYRHWRPTAPAPRPPSVEVEIHTVSDRPHADVEADLPESTRAMLERVFELSQRDVAEIMTPRSAMLTLPATATAREAARALADSGFSRIPLFGENRDDIIGILYAKDLFPKMTESDDSDSVVPRKLARPTLFVPESKNAQELLEEFRARRVQMAIALDEFGGVAGLVTLEDLLEELVGPIDDEHDEPTPSDPIVALGGSRYEVDATMPLEDLNERLGLHLAKDADYLTIGGLAFDALGRLPEPGTSFRRDGIEFTILEVAEHSIRRLRLDLHPTDHPIGAKSH